MRGKAVSGADEFLGIPYAAPPVGPLRWARRLPARHRRPGPRVAAVIAAQYLFSLRNTAFPGVLSPQQHQLAAAMKGYWPSLARRGFPASFTGRLWPRFDSTSQRVLSLSAPQPQVETDFAAEHHCAFRALAG